MSPIDAYFFKDLTSGWKLGEPPTPETIRQGTVRMEEHPDYDAAIQNAKDTGFPTGMLRNEIRVSREAAIEWSELYDLDQNLVRIEKILLVAPGMRFIDLEHELGHIEQFTTRFGDKVPPLAKKIELPNGYRRNVDVLAGIMTVKQQIIVEYHNRLVEFVRLYERRVDVQVLKQHAYGESLSKEGGLKHWERQYFKRGINDGLSTTGMAWMEKYFPEIPELQKQYNEAIKAIEAGEYTEGPTN